MKILFINSRFLPIIGGGETYTMELMRHFRGQGHDVHLITKERGFGKPVWEGCTIHYIDGFDDNDLKMHIAAPMLRHVLDSVRPDVIHVHNIMPYFVLSMVTDSREFPTVFTIHNTPQFPERVFGSFKDCDVEKIFTKQLFLFKKYDALLMGSRYYLDAYASIAPWILEQGAKVAYYFPPACTTGPLKPKTLDYSGRVRLLFPSRILKRKGIEECLQVLARLPERFELDLPSFAYAEDTSYLLEIKQMVKQLGLSHRIITPQSVTLPEAMPAHYRAADMVLIPSHYEGFGIVAVEAMSWGVPVVASRVGGLAEIVTHNQSGLLVEPRDTDSLHAAILDLANNLALANSISKKGVELAQDRFSRDKHMSDIEAIYQSVLKRSYAPATV